MANFEQLATWVEPMLQALKPSERKKLASTLARQLRASQSQRIGEQRNPDGSPYEKRKPQRPGFIKEKLAMFREIRRPKQLSYESTPSAALVGLIKQSAKIGYIHQLGQVDKVYPSGKSVRYARRELLGYTDADVDLIEKVLSDHFAGR